MLAALRPSSCRFGHDARFSVSRVVPPTFVDRRSLIPDEELRVDIYRPAVFLDPAVPETWPSVRVTHLPSGLSVSKRGPRERHNRLLATAELEGLVEEHFPVY